MDNTVNTHKLLSKDFSAPNIMIILGYLNLAVFFTFSHYLVSKSFSPDITGITSVFSPSSLILRPLINPFLFPSNARKWIGLMTENTQT